MDWKAIVSLAVCAGTVLVMAWSRLGPDVVLFGGLVVLVVLGVLKPEDAFSGFANEMVFAVGALLIVARGLRETGSLQVVATKVLGRPSTVMGAQFRLMWPVALASAFLNNTPVVAMMVPTVSDWAKRIGVQPSKLLLPLSYAAIVGGLCTLIGTSTHLVVVGMARAWDPTLHIGLFELAPMGVTIAVAVIVSILVLSRWLLPAREGARSRLSEPREYTVAMRVTASTTVSGRTIEQAGLRRLPGLFLVEIQRAGQSLVAVGPDTPMQSGDVLIFAGEVESVVDLRNLRGLEPAEDQVGKLMQPNRQRRLVEAAVAARSPLVGQSVRDAAFRTRYHAAVIAVHRRGQRVKSRIGDIVFEPGDTLLLEAPSSFCELYRNDPDFAVVSEVEGSTPVQHDRAWLGFVVVGSMVACTITGLLPLVTSSLLAAAAMVVLGALTPVQAQRAVDLRILVAIAASFGLALSLQRSGAADWIAQAIAPLLSGDGVQSADMRVLLSTVYLLTALLSAVTTNNAAAAFMFPVAMSLTTMLGVPPKPVLFVLMMGASASFATPIGYQTNLMVLGPGGYRFSDFLRLGVPLQLLVGVIAVGTVLLFGWGFP